MSLADTILNAGRQPEPVRRPPVRARLLASSGDHGRYLDRVLSGEAERVRSAVVGTRNQTLNRAAFSCAQFAQLSDSDIEGALWPAAEQCGLSQSEIGPTLASGIKAGREEPRAVPEPTRRIVDCGSGAPPAEDDWLPSDDMAPDAPPPSGIKEEAERLQPTADDPLLGCPALSRVAVVGRDRLLSLASEPIDYIWQDLVVAGTIVGIAGPPAEGKTTLLFLILAGRLNASGEPVHLLGHELAPAPDGRWVVLIEGEHGEASAARKLVASFELLEIDNAGLGRIILVARKAVRLGSPEWMDVVRLVAAGLVSDIALDTVARVAPANADNEAEQVAIFDQVAQAIEQAPEGCQPTAWAIMHTRKSSSGELADVSGSAQRTGQADSVFMLKATKVDGRVDEVTVTFQKLRETPDEYPEPASFAIAKGSDGRRVLRQGGPSSVQDLRPLEVRILEQLEVSPRTKNWLSEKLQKNKEAVDEALTNLFSAKQIRTTTITVKGRQFKAFEPWANTGRTPDEGSSK